MSDPQATQNLLLASLPIEELQRLSAHLSPLPLELGVVLVEPGETAQQVYFVQEGMLSYVISTKEGASVEVGVIGREGVGAADVVLANRPSPFQIMVQAVGSAQVMASDDFRSQVLCGGGLYEGAMQQILELAHHGAQNALCNYEHNAEERLCRWLLMVQDRVGSDELALRDSFLEMMLGSRHSGVNLTLSILKRAGLIAFGPDRIHIVNRKALEAAACGCYQALRASEVRAL